MTILNVDPDAVRTHASNVDSCATSLSQALDASASISALSDQAYGILCAWIPPMMKGLHDEFDTVLGDAVEIVTGVADALRAAADDYEIADQSNSIDLLLGAADLPDATVELTS